MIDITHGGQHRVQVFRNGECIQDTGLFNNLLLDSFFTRMTAISQVTWSTGAAGQYCSVGTGVTAVAATDTTLETFLAEKVGADSVVNSFDGISGGFIKYSVTRVFSFVIGSVIGNVSELGTIVSRTSPMQANPLDTRVIIPAPVSVTNQDQLVVTHIRHLQVPTADVVGSVVLDSISYDYIVRPANAANATVLTQVTNPFFWGVSGQSGNNYGRRAYAAGDLPATAGDAWSGGSGDFWNQSASIDEVSSGQILLGRFNLVFAPNELNLTGGVKIIGFLGGSIATTVFLPCEFTPNIPKISSQRLTLDLQVTHSRI